MKKIFIFLLLVSFSCNCKEKNELQFEKVYGKIKVETIIHLSNLSDKNGKGKNDYIDVRKYITKNIYKNGKMISSESYEDIMDGNFKENQHKEVYYYDSENYLIKKMNYFKNFTSDKKWELFNVEKYQYVNSKKIVGIDSVYVSNGSYGTNFYKNPKKKTKIYSLNDEGFIENESSYILNPLNTNDSTLVDQTFKIYDKKGFIVEWRFSYFEKKINEINKSDFKTKIEYNEFDKKGNWTKKTVMTNDNKYQIYIRKITYE